MTTVMVSLVTGEVWSTKVENEATDVFVDSIEQTLTINTSVGGVLRAPMRNVAYWIQSEEDLDD